MLLGCNQATGFSISPSRLRSIILALAVVCAADAQIGIPFPGQTPYPGRYPYPGGSPYPGGGPYPGGSPYPGGPTGGGRRGGNNPTNQPLPNFRGKLKQMDSKNLSLEMDDYRVVQFRLTGKTKFYKNGDTVKTADFKTGDQLSVEGSEDPSGNLTAINVYWEKAASAAADQKDSDNKKDGVEDTWKDKPQGGTEAAPPPTSRAADDPGPPTLRRGKPAPRANDSVTVADEQPPADTPPVRSPQSQPAPTPAPRVEPPKQVAVNLPPNNVDLPPSTVSLPPTTVSEPRTAPGTSGGNKPNIVGIPEATVSRPRPAQPADDDQPFRNEPAEDQRPLGSRHEDPLIQKASDAALDFTETLPNYVVQEVASRYESTTSPPSWHAIDVVSTELVFENYKENYRNITINGKPTNKPLEETGAWSTGEFGTLLIDLFSPATDADFHYLRDGRTSGIDAKIYDFAVKRENSHWDIHFNSQSYTPAYVGSVWIDPKTGRVLRIEIEAKGFPTTFPADHVESATDYSYVRLGGEQQFLLPAHAEILSCQRGTNNCSKNTIDFRNYHKYTGESSIQFGDVK